MNPTRLLLENFRTFERLDLDLPVGIVAILGEVRGVEGADSNGAGKSTLLEAIEVALFGRRSLAAYRKRDQPDDLLVELELEHAGERYRVRRTFSARGRGKTILDLERLTEQDGWEPLTRESAKETQAEIERRIGFTQATWRNSSYLRQGDGSFADADLDAREKKRILTEVLGLAVYDQRREQARDRIRDLERQLNELLGRVEQARDLVATKPDVKREHENAIAAGIDAADTLADRERDHAELARRWQEAREQDAARRAAQAELDSAAAIVQALTARTEAADAAARTITAAIVEIEQIETVDIDALEARRTGLDEKRAEYREHAATVERLRQARADADRQQQEALATSAMLAERAGRLRTEAAAKRDDQEAVCQTCGQHIADNAKERAVAELDRAASDCDEQAKAGGELADRLAARVVECDQLLAAAAEMSPPAEAEYASVVAQIAAARADQVKRATLEERKRQAEPAAASGPHPDEMTAAIELFNAKRAAVAELAPVDVAQIERDGQAAKAAVDVAKAAADAARTARARLEERLAQISIAEDQLAKSTIIRGGLDADLEVAEAVERALAPNGIPTLVLENSAIPAIETDANAFLHLLGCPYTVELRTQAALKSGDGVKDTLEVIVIDPAGDEAPFEECTSGGEKTRIGVALRVGLAKLLANRRGAESRFLALDEPGWLDESGMAALLEGLRSLQGSFDRIYIVSHVPGLRDALDEVLTVVKDADGASRVEEASVFEPVAA